MASSLDPETLALVEMTPAEDLILAILRDALPNIPIHTLVELHQEMPFVLIRSSGSWGQWGGDERFIDSTTLDVQTFAEGLNADSDANLLAEAVRVALRDAKHKVVPGKGYLLAVEVLERPKRAPDWANSVGPVQYADLPAGVQRWETIYRIAIRRPKSKPFPPPSGP